MMKMRKSLLKRTAAVVMSLVMVAGAFMWNRMDVKATPSSGSTKMDWIWYGYNGVSGGFSLERLADHTSDWTFPVTMRSGETVSLGNDEGGNSAEYTIVYYLNGMELCRDSKDAKGGGVYLTIGEPQACDGYTEWLMTPVSESESSKKVWKWRLDAVTEEAPSTGGQSDNEASQKQSSTPHTHSFEWTVTKEPTGSENGLEEYRCKGCGAVEASQPISMYMFRVKELYGLVKDAPKGGAVTYDFGNLATISDYVLAKMAERNDVTVTVSFTYNGEAHSITFPAGTDYTELLNDSEQFYGLLGLNGRYGISVSTIGSGV